MGADLFNLPLFSDNKATKGTATKGTDLFNRFSTAMFPPSLQGSRKLYAQNGTCRVTQLSAPCRATRPQQTGCVRRAERLSALPRRSARTQNAVRRESVFLLLDDQPCPSIARTWRLRCGSRTIDERSGGPHDAVSQQAGGTLRYLVGESIQIQRGSNRHLPAGL